VGALSVSCVAMTSALLRTRLTAGTAACLLFIQAACATTRAPAKHVSSPSPTLVVFLTVDQFRPDYLLRWRSQLTGGLARFVDNGAVYVNGFHDHAITETAPGHSVTLSGRFPVHTGITRNSAGVLDTTVRLIGANPKEPGASPHRFNGTVLLDWMTARDPNSRALSISRKDRGAILPLGRAKSNVFWYSHNGRFTTSTYYRDTLPAWLTAFNDRRIPASYVGKSWELLLPDSAYSEPDTVAIEKNGKDNVFPHRIADDPAAAAGMFDDYPWMDELTLQCALAGLDAMQLGKGASTDLLAISLSTTDAVGHTFGPDSREMHDQILRLDRALGAFFDSLFRVRDSTRVIIALTADHGMTPYPEVRTHAPLSGDNNPNAIRVDVASVTAPRFRALRTAGIPAEAVEFSSGSLRIDRNVLAVHNVDADTVIRSFETAFRALNGVRRVDRISALQKADTVHDAIARRWLHMFASDEDAALVVTLDPYNYWGKSGQAQHGSPHDSDARVPIVFWGTPFIAGLRTDTARVVDLAPTLARAIGVKPTERTDGHILTAVLHEP
jgi:predicted AlkP superfamily pyrophosphatase or phosphodiesterase